MDRVPDSAVCNEAVKLTQKKGFYNLKGFVNGILRNIVRQKEQIKLPDPTKPLAYLSVTYSMPFWLVERWVVEFGYERTEAMLADFIKERPTTIRCTQYMIDKELTLSRLKSQGIKVEQAPYLENAFYISGYNYLGALDVFQMGCIVVQDVSSMLVAEVAAPKQGDVVIDLCAAPGGKSLHIGDKMLGYGRVDARDITEAKVALLEENIQRVNAINISASCKDATVFDPDSVDQADIVLADVPCSGLGVIGKKNDIKYKITKQKQEDLIVLQRRILHNAATYVKPGGTLIYSTCTIGTQENQDNIQWFLSNYPYRLDSLDPYLTEELKSNTTKEGYLQLLPGMHQADGFFIARLKRK
jgi:16S rRNA (cytosine967-C5)-methyltransferase